MTLVLVRRSRRSDSRSDLALRTIGRGPKPTHDEVDVLKIGEVLQELIKRNKKIGVS